MAYWLLKTDTDSYTFDDLVRERRATWDGVSNAQALIYLRQMTRGDEVVIYHSGAEKAVIGRATVARGPMPDPKLQDPKRVVVDITAGPRLARPITLAEIKAEPAFREFLLVKNSRLSVMPVPAPLWKRLLALAR